MRDAIKLSKILGFSGKSKIDTVALLNLLLLPSRKTAKLIFSGAAPGTAVTPMLARLCIHGLRSHWLVLSVIGPLVHAYCWLLLYLRTEGSFGSDRMSGGTDLTLFEQHPLVTYHTAGTYQPYGGRADAQVATAFLIQLTLPRYLVNASVIRRSLLSVAGRVIMHLCWFRPLVYASLSAPHHICDRSLLVRPTSLRTKPTTVLVRFSSKLPPAYKSRKVISLDGLTLSDSRHLDTRLSFLAPPLLTRCVFEHVSYLLKDIKYAVVHELHLLSR